MLHDQIADEIAERQRFIDSMRALGKAGQHELRIKNEIADRMSDLARVERLQRAAASRRARARRGRWEARRWSPTARKKRIA